MSRRRGRDGGGHRDSSSGEQIADGGHLHVAQALAHPKQQAAAAGVAGAHQKRASDSGRSSANSGSRDAGHVRSHGWSLSTRGGAASVAVGSDACLHGRSRGGNMTGGEKLSAPMATMVRRRGRARGERGKGQGLTVIPVEATVRPGRGWSSRIPSEFAGG